MPSDDETFTREFDIDVINKTLILHQKIVGDVSCVIWDAAIVLAKYLEELYKRNKNVFTGKKLVELGAGLGCVGLTAACLGGNVVLTDLLEVLQMLDKNIKQNKDVIKTNNGSAFARELTWGNDLEIDFIPDKIILADCVYYKESINPLVETLKKLAGPNTEILLSQEMRESTNQQQHWNHFLNCMEKIFNIDYVPLSEQNTEYSSPDIKLIKLKKKICEL